MTSDESTPAPATMRCDTCLRRRRPDETGWRQLDLGGGQTSYRCPACEARATTARR